MCCCGKPTINGEIGVYSWDGERFGTREPAPPPLADGDMLLVDEPGRCGGLDAHSHHFRLVKSRQNHVLLVRHGGGDERITLTAVARLALPALLSLDTNARYWLLHTIYSTQQRAREQAATDTDRAWRKAAADEAYHFALDVAETRGFTEAEYRAFCVDLCASLDSVDWSAGAEESEDVCAISADAGEREVD